MGKQRCKMTERIQEILRGAAATGKTLAEAARLAECSVDTVARFAKSEGLKFARRRSRDLTEQEIEQIKRMDAEGATTGEITRELGVADSTVRKYIKRESECKSEREPKALADDPGAYLAAAIMAHAEAITKLAEAIELNASAGKEAVIKVKVDGGELTLPQDASLIVTKVERARPDWQ